MTLPNLPSRAEIDQLTDLEIALLICLVAEQHCIIRASADRLDDVEREIQVIAQQTFGLRSDVLACSQSTSLDAFGSVVFGAQDSNPDDKPNVVVAKRLNLAHRNVQVMALELIRNNRITTTSGTQEAARPILLVTLVDETYPGPPFLTLHLNDALFISHTITDDTPLPSTTLAYPPPKQLKFPPQALALLRKETALVRTTAEMRRYLHDIPTFLRLHRAVGGGVSALATRHLNLLVRTLAPLHAQSYVTPSLVGLAAHKVYSHRVVLTAPEDERSMQWGSDLEAVKEALEGVRVEDVIREVLGSVQAPL